MFKQKKAQFYFFIMIILLAIATVFIVSKPTPSLEQSTKYFLKNLDVESGYAVNNALIQEKNVTQELNNFFDEMKLFGKGQRISMEYSYLLINETHYIFVNQLSSEIYLPDFNQRINPQESLIVARGQEERINFGVPEYMPDVRNFIYKYYITKEYNQLRYFVIIKRGKNYEVHIKDGME